MPAESAERPAAADTAERLHSIIVVGAGLSGLATARALLAHDVDVLVLEAATRPGGVIRSGRVAGHLLEWGPQRGRLTPGLRALIGELDLENSLIVAPPDLPLFIFRDGALREVPFSLRALVGSDLFSVRGRLRLLAEPLTRSARADETVAAFVRRRFGSEAYLHLIGPLFGGLYASDPEQMLVRHALRPLLRQLGAERSALLALARRGFARAVAASPPFSFIDGMQTLADALYASMVDHVSLDERVTALRRIDAGFEITTSAGVRRSAELVLTVDARTAARLLADVDADAAASLGRLVYNRFAVVHLHTPATLHGMGYQVSLAEAMATRGVTFNASLFGRTGVYTAFLGGARQPALVDHADDEIGRVARAEFRAVTGRESGVIAVQRVEIPAWDVSWTALDSFVPPPGVHLCANYESRAGIPGRLARAEALARALARKRGGRQL